MKNLFQALSNFQAECPKITKDANNPFFSDAKRKVNYASLPNILTVINPILKKNGLVITQPVVNGGVITKLVHIESGEILESIYDIICKDQTNPQQLGSAVSYARRYSISSMLNLNIDDDDDGNSASGNNVQQKKEELTPNHPAWLKAVKWLQEGGLYSEVEARFTITPEMKKILLATK